MSLDLQSNWDAAMADSLRETLAKSKRTTEEPDTVAEQQVAQSLPDVVVHHGDPVYLPDEIILQILGHVRHFPSAQSTLYSCTLLSRQWFEAAIPMLYEHPRLEGNNFEPFVRAICPSFNLHVRKSPTSELVRILNMGRLVHQSSKSTTARLLGRTKDNLEHFVAPQSSFAINCFPALAKCKKLKRLDLSLVSEAASLQTLFKTVKGLPTLTELRLPRSSGFGHKVDAHEIVWPPKLERLYLSGSIDAHFLYGVVQLPQTLTELTLEHCPSAKGHAVRQFLETIAREQVPLRYLKLSHMPRLSDIALDYTLALLPNLETLSVSVDYISPNLIDMDFHGFQPGSLKLRILEFTNSGNPGVEDKLSPLDVIIAMDDGSLPSLRQVRVVKSLRWRQTTREDFDALDDALLDAATKEGTDAMSSEHRLIRTGVWEIDG